MSKNNYVVVFDPINDQFDPVAIRNAMKAEERIINWWNHIFNCFLVMFDGDADELASTLYRSAHGVRFFVMHVDPRDSEGILAERSWSWIKKRELELDRGEKQPTA